MNMTLPLPEKELERLLSLSEYDLDYTNIQDNFKDLTKLAAKVAGTEISLVNLIDTYTQWSIASHGLEIDQMPREESVCQYTIAGNDTFEVKNLAADDRFLERFYVSGDLKLRYYFGVPLQNEEGFNLGALCVLDKYPRTIDPEKIELLKIIAAEIVNRLNTLKVIEGLKYKVNESNQTKLKVAHDIRGPLNGIISLAKLISDQGDNNKLEDVLKFISLIQKSGSSILELANEILTGETTRIGKTLNEAEKAVELKGNEMNLPSLKEKLEKLYSPQAIAKKINLNIITGQNNQNVAFLKNKLLQITGNLISNSLKFTSQNGIIDVQLDLIKNKEQKFLQIIVADNGVGLSAEGIDNILQGNKNSSDGTTGEKGYGFGLSLVRHLIQSLHGKLNITSVPGEGATFIVTLPQIS